MSNGDRVTKKKLIFKTKDDALKKPVSLVLTFWDAADAKKNKNQKAVAWRVVRFPTSKSAAARLTYRNQYCFIHPQVNSGNYIYPSVHNFLNIGEQTSLVEDPQSGDITFTGNTPGEKGVVRIDNKTRTIQDIAIGMGSNTEKEPSIIAWYTNVAVDQMVSFTPLSKLYCYVVDAYDRGLFMGDIGTKPAQIIDLPTLPPETIWYLTVIGTTGQYTLTSEEPDDDRGGDIDHQ